jgi:hypothetical protein
MAVRKSGRTSPPGALSSKTPNLFAKHPLIREKVGHVFPLGFHSFHSDRARSLRIGFGFRKLPRAKGAGEEEDNAQQKG